MHGFSDGTAATILLAGGLVLSSLAFLAAAPGPAQTEAMGFWEASARGLVSVTMQEETYQRGEVTVTLPVGIRVDNAAGVPVSVSEEAVLMSPFPSESPPGSGATTQDAVLTTRSIPAGGSLTYFFGEEVLRGFLQGPLWWCTEEFQFTRDGVAFEVGGEILPFDLKPVLADEHWETPDSNTQVDFWDAVRTRAAVVVGKAPLWTTVPARAGEQVQVDLRATNLAVYTFEDAVTADVNVTDGVIEDRVPAGWGVEEGSYDVPPDEVLDAPDGSRILRWRVDLPAAVESDEEDPREPTAYETVHRSYVLVTPALSAGRVELPRALSDMDADGIADAHSAPSLIDAESTESPPVPDAGGPYAAAEGDTVLLNASGASDPDGDVLSYRWDVDDDGTFETGWSTDPTAAARYVDDFAGNARVEVTDGRHTVSATASVTIENVAPEILSVSAAARAEFRLAVAGEKWHDVHLEVRSGPDVVGSARVVRVPGSPAHQAQSTGELTLDLATGLAVTVAYTPADDPLNGRAGGDSPAWLVLAFPDGSEVRFSHNFNAQRESTWTWDLRDLGPAFAAQGLALEARVRDAGADDLQVTWDFDDGSKAVQTFPSSGDAPSGATSVVLHAFEEAREYRVSVVVVDDDGGSAEATQTVRFP